MISEWTSSTAWWIVSDCAGTDGSRAMVSVEPTGSTNGDVHAVAGLPSTACQPVASGLPVSRFEEVAAVSPVSEPSTSSVARRSSRSVTAASVDSARGSVSRRTIDGSGSLRHRSSGSVRSRVRTSETGVDGSARSSTPVGTSTTSRLAPRPSSAKPTADGPVSVPPGRGATDVIVMLTPPVGRPSITCPGATRERSSSATSTGADEPSSAAMRTPVIIRLATVSCGCSSVSCPSMGDTSSRSPTGSARSPTTHAVDGSPSTAMAGRCSGR